MKSVISTVNRDGGGDNRVCVLTLKCDENVTSCECGWRSVTGCRSMKTKQNNLKVHASLTQG